MGDSPTPSDHTLQVQRLFVQHQQVVLYYVLTIEPNLGDAQDIVQEAFLTVSRKAETYALGTNFPAWACTVARYNTLHFQRTRSRRVARLDDDVVELLYPTGGFDEDSFKHRMAALQGCMGKLAPRAYELVMLRYHNDQMPEQIAVTVGWSVNAVRVALSRSRQLLRECLDRRLAVNEVS